MSRSSSDARARPAITIIATARSGGALNTYGVFKGTKVYTIYIGTRIGMAVLQYAERVPNARGFEEDLAPPEPLASEFPADIKRARLLVSCVLDTSGTVKNLRIVESDAAADTERIMAALAAWRFRPVLRNNQPIEVDAMLGFNMDTR
jgi:TonB family protein